MFNRSQNAKKGTGPKPPEKGSFPLDHDAECIFFKEQYLKCLKENNWKASLCNNSAKDYFACRMDNGLMDRDEFTRLGIPDKQYTVEELPQKPTSLTERQVQGFTPGLGKH